MLISQLTNCLITVSIIKAYLQGIIASLDPYLVLNKSWFTCYCRRKQKFMASHDFRRKCKNGRVWARHVCAHPAVQGLSFQGAYIHPWQVWKFGLATTSLYNTHSSSTGSSLYWRLPWWDHWTGLQAWQFSLPLGLRMSSNLTEPRHQLCGQARPGSTWSLQTWSWQNWLQIKFQRLQLAAMTRWSFVQNMG